MESALAQADKRASYHAIKGMLGEGTDIERTCGLVRMYHQGKVCWILESEEQSFRANNGQPAPRRSVQETRDEAVAELQRAADTPEPSLLSRAGQGHAAGRAGGDGEGMVR